MFGQLLPDKNDMWRIGIGIVRATPVIAGLAVYAKTNSLPYSIASAMLGGIFGAYAERRIRSSEVGNAITRMSLSPGTGATARRTIAAFAGLR